MASPLSWLDGLLFGYRRVYYYLSGVLNEAPERPAFEFAGTGVTVTDNTTTKRTVVTFSASAGSVGSLTVASPLENTGTEEDPVIELTGTLTADQHGEQLGGELHADATAIASGFLSAADFEKLQGIEENAQRCTFAHVAAALEDATIDIFVNGQKITGCADPEDDQDVATMAWVLANAGGGGTVEGVTGTAPIAVDNADPANPVVSIAAASGSVAGSMSSSDFTKLSSVAYGAQVCSYGNVASALAAAGGATTTAGGPMVARTDAIATTRTNALIARNATAATALIPVQVSGALTLEGHGYTASDKTMSITMYALPRASGNVDLVARYDSGSGSYSSAFGWSSSTPGQFVEAFQAFGVAVGSNGVFFDSSNNGLFQDGPTMALQIKSRYSDLLIETEDGGMNLQIADGGFFKRQWGAPESRVTLEQEFVVETTNTTVDALSFPLPSNIVGKLTVHAFMIDLSTGDTATYELIYKFKRRAGGTPVLGTAVEVLVDEDDSAWNCRVELDSNDLVLRVEGDAVHTCVGRVRWVIDYYTFIPS